MTNTDPRRRGRGRQRHRPPKHTSPPSNDPHRQPRHQPKRTDPPSRNPHRQPKRTSPRGAVVAAMLLAMIASVVGCASADRATEDSQATATSTTDHEIGGGQPGQADEASAEALAEMAKLMAGPGGVHELSSRLDEALSAHLGVLEDCRDKPASDQRQSCFVEQRRQAGPPEQVQTLLEQYLSQAHNVWQTAAQTVADTPAHHGAETLQAAQHWYEATLLAARAAMAAVECLQAVELAQFSTWMDRCDYHQDLYSAALHDQNRLRQHFEHTYLTLHQPQDTTPNPQT